jgi:hypothetical protein
MEKNWIGDGILLSGVFFDLTQFNFHGLLFSQKKEDHPHHQDQHHCQGEYNYVSKEIHEISGLELSEFFVGSVREKQRIQA